jgi:acyl carrier protein
MTYSEIESRIRSFLLSEIIDPADVAENTAEMPLISSGLMNSLSTLKLVAFLEETFGVELAAHEIGVDYLDTLADITRFVESKLG